MTPWPRNSRYVGSLIAPLASNFVPAHSRARRWANTGETVPPPRRVAPDAWRARFRYAPHPALEASPARILGTFAAIAIVGGPSLLPTAAQLGYALAPFALAGLAACLQAREAHLSWHAICAHFLTRGWQRILLLYLPTIYLCSPIGIAILTADQVFAAHTAAHAPAHAVALPALATACQDAIIDFCVLCGFPELVFTALLACGGTPAALAISLARRAGSLNRRALLALTVTCLGAALALNRYWFLAPLLVSLSVTAAHLAYREIFHDHHPEPAFSRTPAESPRVPQPLPGKT